MSEKECQRINKALADYSAREYTEGYGLFNVNNRICLTYGNDYGLHYKRNDEGGITVILSIPFIARPRGKKC